MDDLHVTLMAFGRRGYAYAGANLIASLRYYGYGGGIDLWVDARCHAMLPSWVHEKARVRLLPEALGTDPGWLKVNLPGLIDRPTIYLDVDSIALKDITPWALSLNADGRDYITCVKGAAKVGQPMEYYAWAETTKVQHMEGFADDATYYGIQSSWAFLRPGQTLDRVHAVATEAYERWTVRDLKHTWGGSKPDELFWSIACTRMGHDPAWSGEPVHWGGGFMSVTQMAEKHYILSLWGMGRGKASVPSRHVEKYDAIMRLVMKTMGQQYQTKSHYLRQDKWCNNKNR